MVILGTHCYDLGHDSVDGASRGWRASDSNGVGACAGVGAGDKTSVAILHSAQYYSLYKFGSSSMTMS